MKPEFEGDGGLQIDRLVHPAEADRSSDLALAMNKDAVAALERGKAQAAVVAAKSPTPSGAFKALILVDDPRLALARLTALFDPGPAYEPGVHPTAVVAPDALIGEGVSIGPYAVVGARSRIGAGTVILPQVTVGADVEIGAQCLFHAGVRIGDRVRVGNGVIIHANAVIGADGFSYAPDLASPTAFVPGMVVTRVHSLGTVELADEVEIGAGTTIDRSTIETTRIGRAHQNRQSRPHRPQCHRRGKLHDLRHGRHLRQRSHRRSRAAGGRRGGCGSRHDRRSGGGRRRLRGRQQRGGGHARVRFSGAAAPALGGAVHVHQPAEAPAWQG